MTRYSKQERSSNRQAKPPALIAWHIVERDKRSYWHRLGAAWEHQDGAGLTLELELLPIAGGRIVLRVPGQSEGETDEERA